MANLDINAIVQQPLTDERYEKLADAIKKALEVGGRKKKKFEPRDLSHRGLPPASLNKTLEKVWQYVLLQEWTMVYRFGYDLVAEGVDWVPGLSSVVSLSCLSSSHRHQAILAAKKSLLSYPEQSGAYLTVAVWKFENGLYKDCLRWLDLASLGIQPFPSIANSIHQRASWALKNDQKHITTMWPYVKAPHFLARLQRDRRYDTCQLSIDPTLEGVIASLREKADIYDDFVQIPVLNTFLKQLWEVRHLFVQRFGSEPDAKTSQPQSLIGPFSMSLFQEIVKHDPTLVKSLGSTCRTLRGWSDSLTTWQVICQHRSPHITSPVKFYNVSYAKSVVMLEYALKEACHVIFNSIMSKMTENALLVAERFEMTQEDSFSMPLRVIFANLVDWTSVDVTGALTEHFFEKVPNLVEALVIYASMSDYPIQIRSIFRVLISLILGDRSMRVIRMMDFYGVSELARCATVFGFNEAKSLLCAIITGKYFYKMPLKPVFISIESMQKMNKERIDSTFVEPHLSGVWHLVLMDNGAHKESFFERAIVYLKFDPVTGSVEGSGFSSIGTFKLLLGYGSFSLENATIFFHIKHDCSPNTTSTFDGTPHAFGFGGRFGIQSAANYRQSAANTSLHSDTDPLYTKSELQHGSWLMCKDSRDFNFGPDLFPPIYSPSPAITPSPSSQSSTHNFTSNGILSSTSKSENIGSTAVSSSVSDSPPSSSSTNANPSDTTSNVSNNLTNHHIDDPSVIAKPQPPSFNFHVPELVSVSIEPYVSQEASLACWNEYCTQLTQIGLSLGRIQSYRKTPMPDFIAIWVEEINRAFACVEALTTSEASTTLMNEIEARNPEINSFRTLQMSKVLLRLEMGILETPKHYERRQGLFDRCSANLFELRLLMAFYSHSSLDGLKRDIAILRSHQIPKDIDSVYPTGSIDDSSPELKEVATRMSILLSWMHLNPYESLRSLQDLAQFLEYSIETYAQKSPIPQNSGLASFLLKPSRGLSHSPSSLNNAENGADLEYSDVESEDEDADASDPFRSKRRRQRASSSSGYILPIVVGVLALIGVGAGVGFLINRRRK